jgi:tetratricopeptide (TPR) repeat protein
MLNMDYYFLLNAEIHIAQGNGQAAIDSLNQVSYRARDYSARYMILMPASHELLGEIEKAINLYLQSPYEVNRIETNMGDQFHFYIESSRIDFYVAKIYDRHGNAPKAIEHYEKFLELWKDADPGVAEVEDAKKKLADLKSGS